MQSKLEMMFTDNKRSTQCRLTRLANLTPVEITSTRLRLERQFASVPTNEVKSGGRKWLADIEVDDPLVASLFDFSQAIGPQASEWDHYNALLERFYEKYETYLNENNKYEKLLGRTAPLELKMLNAGESIERDLEVRMRLPQGIVLYTEQDYPKRPIEPVPPEKPAPVYEKMLNGT